MSLPSIKEQVHEETEASIRPEGKRIKRLTVDLSSDAAGQLEKLLQQRGLSISQAVRQALSLLALVDETQYDLILRNRSGKEADQRIVLVK